MITHANVLKNYSTAELAQHKGNSPVALHWRQFKEIFKISLKKSFFSKQTLLIFVLALAPIFITLIAALEESSLKDINAGRQGFGYIYAVLISGAVIFLGSAAYFISAFRGEILERSMHYYMLAPVRRDLIVYGKYCACLLTAMLIFSISTVVSYLMLYLATGTARLAADIGNGIAVTQLASYLLMSVLASIGYGSLFMAIGLAFRNPLLPILILAGLEFIYPLLPTGLKFLSIRYYVISRMPVVLTNDPFAIISSPMPVWASILGVVTIAGVALCVSIRILRRLEVKYLED